MLVRQFRDCLDLEYRPLEIKKVRLVGLAENTSLVFELKPWLRYERNAPISQFKLKAFLIHRLGKTASFILINFKACA